MIERIYFFFPYPLEDLLSTLRELQSAVSTGKDSL